MPVPVTDHANGDQDSFPVSNSCLTVPILLEPAIYDNTVGPLTTPCGLLKYKSDARNVGRDVLPDQLALSHPDKLDGGGMAVVDKAGFVMPRRQYGRSPRSRAFAAH